MGNLESGNIFIPFLEIWYNWRYRPQPSQVEWYRSHSNPVSRHLGPFKFGETSPKLLEANAATNGP